MKKLLSIAFLTAAFSHVAYSQKINNDTILITDGEGIDKIALLHSSERKIKQYKKAMFSVDKEIRGGHPSRPQYQVFCREAIYKNDSLGITFYFSTSFKKKLFLAFAKLRLKRISVTKNAKTVKGLIIGKSTKQDVIAIYKNELGNNDPKGSTFNFTGITFTFNEKGGIAEIDVFDEEHYF